MRFALSLSLLLIVLPVLAAGPGTASGKLTINGKTANLTHAYATRAANPFDISKQVSYIVLSDQEVPLAVLDDTPERMMKYDDDHHLSSIELMVKDEDKQVISVDINSPNLTGDSHLPSGGVRKLELTAMDRKHIAGRIYLAEKTDDLDNNNTYTYDIKFDAPFSAAPTEPATEALKGTQLPAGGGDPGKAYMAYTKVLAAGDLKALHKALAADRAKRLDEPDFKQMLPKIQVMQKTSIKVTGGTVDGDTATLITTGKDGKFPSNGTITMVRESGAWKVEKESWTTQD